MNRLLEVLDLHPEESGAGNGSFLACEGETLGSVSPIDGKTIAGVRTAAAADYEKIVRQAEIAFDAWRAVPAPKRGEIVRQIGEALRRRKPDLGALISLEMGKIRAEGEGEVQEMIDMADLAVGQSRMLYGKTMASERPGHRLYEQWHPLGMIGVITSFNFPVAPWAWNAMIALATGNTVIWKPSSKVPLTAIATMKIVWRVMDENGLPPGILSLAVGRGDTVGELLITDSRVPLISATGSVRMGRRVGQAVAARLGRSILELGGNNAIIITPGADIRLALQAVVFGAAGTAGQRCTTTRRLIVHEKIYDRIRDGLVTSYRQLKIGNPLEDGVLVGPLIDTEAVTGMQKAIDALRSQGGSVLYGGDILSGGLYDAGTYVTPCICEAAPDMPIVAEETFAPILYLMKYRSFEEAIAWQNSVPQGLSSAVFTNDLREAERFLSYQGSDCGIANVNVGTSGAEIGGAFGGEKDTGGGREAGSDVWKFYMRRQTCTINWSNEMPLAQGIRFGTD